MGIVSYSRTRPGASTKKGLFKQVCEECLRQDTLRQSLYACNKLRCSSTISTEVFERCLNDSSRQELPVYGFGQAWLVRSRRRRASTRQTYTPEEFVSGCGSQPTHAEHARSC